MTVILAFGTLRLKDCHVFRQPLLNCDTLDQNWILPKYVYLHQISFRVFKTSECTDHLLTYKKSGLLEKKEGLEDTK